MSSYNDPNFDKKLYWERRERGLRGTVGAVTVHQPVVNEKGEVVERVAIGDKIRNGWQNSRTMRKERIVNRAASKKGYTEHRVNPPAKVRGYEPELTNKVRHQMRNKVRSDQWMAEKADKME